MKRSLRSITRNVYLLGALSLFNDLSADMIAPLLPSFLASFGLGAGFLGMMEGVANALSHITTLLSGWLVDRYGRSKQIAVAGYSLSAFLRPLIAIPIPGLVLAVRFLDRIGKGIRTAPRDHLLTDSLEKKHWGKAFGIQRGMDHFGALMAPLVATFLLTVFSISLSKLFLIAALPAILSILIIPFWIQKGVDREPENSPRLSWNHLPSALKRYLFIVFLAALSSPSELFLILKLQELGLATRWAPLAYGLLTLCTMLSTFLGGYLADRWSKRRILAVGWTLFALIFIGFGFNSVLLWGWVLIACFGIQAGLVEASKRAYPAALASASIRASALGWFYFAWGMGLLPASILFGLLWKKIDSHWAFLIFAGLTLLIVPLLRWLPSDRPKENLLGEGILSQIPPEPPT